MLSVLRRIVILALFVCITMQSKAQLDSLGINFQGVARTTTGSIIPMQAISLRFDIYAGFPSGVPLWQETHNLVTNTQGLYSVVIGKGTSTGIGSLSAFYLIDWSTANHHVIVSMDPVGGAAYAPVDTFAFQAVPYAFYSGRAAMTEENIYLNHLSDVDTSGLITGQLLKWNGMKWLPAYDNDSDSAQFAYSSSTAVSADTAQTAINLVNIPDTVLYAATADTAAFSGSSGYANEAQHAINADTAQYALNCSGSFTSWSLNGNAGTIPGTHFMGTTDNTDLVFKTNNVERMRITNSGNIGIGTASPQGSFHLNSNDGFISTGVFGTGSSLTVTGAGTRMFWYPKKAAFRVGAVSAGAWDEINIGNYSFACGYDNVARGDYSFAAGQSSTVYSNYSAAIGYGNIANGICSFVAGSANSASAPYAIALGRGCVCSDSSAIAIGYHTNSSGKYAIGFGFQNLASGNYSITMGYHANTNNKTGSIVFADASSSSYTPATANNQFVVRASGGYYFYSNAGMSTGVTLAAGSGSWATLSDRHKKTNFREIDSRKVLAGIAALEVYSWNYKTQDEQIRHIGPTAQDFYHSFGFGENDTTISAVDIDGINLFAVKELEKQTRELKEKALELEKMQMELNAIRKQKQELETRVMKLEQLMNKKDLE